MMLFWAIPCKTSFMAQQMVLVVDDDPEINRLTRQYLTDSGFLVHSATSATEAWQKLIALRPDLLLLDLGLPDKDGWELTRNIRADRQIGKIPIIMLTARIDDTDKIIGLEMGADDYIPKPFNAREVVARIRAMLRRRGWDQNDNQPIMLKAGDLTLDIERRLVTLKEFAIELTPTEFKLLQTLMESPGATFHREELLEKAMGYGYEGLGRTLDTHIKNLRQKIESDPKKPSFIQTVYRIGYRFVVPEEAL